MDPINITRHGDDVGSNWNLRGEPIRLRAYVEPCVETPDDGSWENEGGAGAPDAYEVENLERYQSRVRIHQGRKQRAAKIARPTTRIHRVPLSIDTDPYSVLRRLEEQDEQRAAKFPLRGIKVVKEVEHSVTE